MSRTKRLPPAPRPRKLRCVAVEKGVVVEADLPPKVTAPDVMRWGSRIFVLSEVQPKPEKVVIYREATVRRITIPRKGAAKRRRLRVIRRRILTARPLPKRRNR